ncbi:hypothetical protein HKD37_04G010180 [Glycine soja]
MKANTSYFALIDRKTLNELGAVVSTPHLKMKFPTLTGKVVTIKVISIDEGSLIRALIAYQASLDENFDVDPCNNTSDRGLKPIKEIVKLQLRLKPR